MLSIGENIKKLRELKSITRETMCEKLELSMSGYSKIERGETDLTVSRVQQIAEILEVDLSQIMNFDASQVFNVSNNKIIQSVSTKGENIHFHGDDYKEKYIQMLEAENERLKNNSKKR